MDCPALRAKSPCLTGTAVCRAARAVVWPCHYPQVSPRVAKFQPSARAASRFHPRQSVRVPGRPSLLRARKPPSLAIQVTTSPAHGGSLGGGFFLCVLRNRTCHSSSARNCVHGVSGVALAMSVIMNRRQATMLMTIRYRVRRFACPKRQDSTRNPDFRTLKYISMRHRRQYQRTFSQASSKDRIGRLVSSIHSTGSSPSGGFVSSAWIACI
jgi:hypothetical protein